MRRLQSCWRGQMVTPTSLSSGCVCVCHPALNLQTPGGMPGHCISMMERLAIAQACVHLVQMEESMRMKQERLLSEPSGAPGAMQVSFRGVDPFNTWVSMRLLPPLDLLSGVDWLS